MNEGVLNNESYPHFFEKFLKEKLWSIKSESDTAFVYLPPKDLGFDDGFTLLIPRNFTSDRYLNDTIKFLTELYQGEFIEYVALDENDSVLPWVVESRLIDASIGHGTISLPKLDKFISSISKSLLEVARFKLPADDLSQKFLAQKFVEACEFLPTKKGSFIASIEVKREIVMPGDLFSESILSNQLIRSWFSALDFLNNSVIKNENISNENDQVLIKAFGLLSLPLIESFGKLITDVGISNYEFTLSSGERRVISTTGDLNRSTRARLDEFIDIFKEALTKEDDIEVEGRIVELRSRNPAGDRNHIAIVSDFHGDQVNISMSLNNEAYQTACEAHQKGKVVTVRGSAQRLKTQMRIIKLESFEIKV